MLPNLAGKSVAIVGGGATSLDYFCAVGAHGSRNKIADEIWAVGPIAEAIFFDRKPGTELSASGVVGVVRHDYLTCTGAFAIAAAIACRARRIFLFGLEDEDRGCVEFWIGVAVTKGIEVTLPLNTPLMAMNRRSAKS